MLQETETTITLRGSVETVTEFFEYSVNNILYQRGVYPPETFKRASKYGLTLFVTTDDSLCVFMNNILTQLRAWLLSGSVQKLILVIKGIDSNNTLERWAFDCEANVPDENKSSSQQPSGAMKANKEVTSEIQAIMRQITASVTFLPLLDEPCSFDLLVYADKAATVPVTWEDSDPCIIKNAEQVQLRSFSTNIHRVDLKVSYRVDEDGI